MYPTLLTSSRRHVSTKEWSRKEAITKVPGVSSGVVAQCETYRSSNRPMPAPTESRNCASIIPERANIPTMFNLAETDPIRGGIEALYDSAWHGSDDTPDHIYDADWPNLLKHAPESHLRLTELERHLCLTRLDWLEAMTRKDDVDIRLVMRAVDGLEGMLASHLFPKHLESNTYTSQPRGGCTWRRLAEVECEAVGSDCSTTYHDMSSCTSDDEEEPDNSYYAEMFDLPRVCQCSPSGTESVLLHGGQRVPASSERSRHTQADRINAPITFKNASYGVQPACEREETYADWWLWSSGGGLEDEQSATTLPTLSRVKSVVQLPSAD